MNVRRIAAVAALPCLCLMASEADAQRRRAAYRPIVFELPPSSPPRTPDQRLPELQDRAPRSTGMLESWAIDEDAEIGVGRYAVGAIARPRTNLERERMMERENRNIAGAGMRVRF